MSTAQFAMVEELAFLIKDNLSSKHIVLSIEETLIDFLQNDTSPDGVLELEPMSSYHRLLLHRLADIYGFTHESVGEGDDRHLILERCSESSIPSVLVSDILWQYDQSPSASHQLLRRNGVLPALKMNCCTSLPPATPFEEREAAYLAARERIFSLDDAEIKESSTPKQRNVPVVARRMIAHALGQRISTDPPDTNPKLHESPKDKLGKAENNKANMKLRGEDFEESILSPAQPSSVLAKANDKPTSKGFLRNSLQAEESPIEASEGSSAEVVAKNGTNGRVGISKERIKREHMGAAKRMFAHALRLPKEGGSVLLKSTESSKQVGLKS